MKKIILDDYWYSGKWIESSVGEEFDFDKGRYKIMGDYEIKIKQDGTFVDLNTRHMVKCKLIEGEPRPEFKKEKDGNYHFKASGLVKYILETREKIKD